MTKARPTEYCGTVFRSKGEARVALLLDTFRQAWQYEPPFLTVDEWSPDFLCVNLLAMSFHQFNSMNFELAVAVVEYKPRRPTETYLAELAGRFSTCFDTLERSPLPLSVRGELLVGGMGYSEAESISFRRLARGDCWWTPSDKCKPTWNPNWDGVLYGVEIDEANERLAGYRFDLDGATVE